MPEGNLHVVPDAIPLEAAVFVEPLAAACEILDQTDLARGSKVAVLGDGKLGLLIAQVLHAHGCHVRNSGKACREAADFFGPWDRHGSDR